MNDQCEKSALLKELRTSADVAAHHAQNVYLSFLLFGLYFAVTVGSTTHEQFLKKGNITLPLLSVGLPVVGFYVVAPVLLVLFHFNLLLQLYLLSGQLRVVDQEIELLLPERQNQERGLLYPFPFSHMLVGKQHPPIMRCLLRIIVWVTVSALPVGLLTWTQIRFCPYHSAWITRWHCFIIVFDLALLWSFWPTIVKPKQGWRHWWAVRQVRWAVVRNLLVTLTVLCVCAYFVGPSLEGKSASRVHLVKRMDRLLPRNLQLPGRILVEEAPAPELVAAYVVRSGSSSNEAWRSYARGLDLEKRDLRRANLFGARLVRANLRGADLRSADLEEADLRNADLRGAQLQGANLRAAQLQGAFLERAQLQGASLERAQLQGAIFWRAKLQGAFLLAANAQSADFQWAQLQGALFENAQLQGADLGKAELEGAFFHGAGLWNVTIDGADLSLADLRAVDVAPLSEAARQQLRSELAPPGFDQKQRQDMVARLELQRGEGQNLLSLARVTKDQALYDQGGIFSDWGTPPEEMVQQRALATYLIELACSDRDVARGIVRRTLYNPNAPSARPLAKCVIR